eukprot:m.118931 g.118931  ORF g.118931 m.118931 type:complete len:360 (+) comp9535_c0_seq8:858-1937(+)
MDLFGWVHEHPFKALACAAAGAGVLAAVQAVVRRQRAHEPTFRVLFIRHGESLGNVEPETYRYLPDHRIPLTENGKAMAHETGTALKRYFEETFGDPSQAGRIKMWVSPFRRTRATAHHIRKVCAEWITDAVESPLLVEQDWGLFEGPGLEQAAIKFPDEWHRASIIAEHQGKFWARFPMGESCFDVCVRVAALFGSINRDRFPLRGYRRRGEPINTIVIISHGITIRAFIMMWCKKSPEWFQNTINPPNCSIRLIESDIEGWDCGYIFGGFGPSGPVDKKKLNDQIATGRMRTNELDDSEDSPPPTPFHGPSGPGLSPTASPEPQSRASKKSSADRCPESNTVACRLVHQDPAGKQAG